MLHFKPNYSKYFTAIVLTIVLAGCASSGKTALSKAKEAQLDSLVTQKNFVVSFDRAMPLMTNSMNSIANSGLFPPGSTPNQINLIGNSNYLKIMRDSVVAELPYFGERQMGGGYNGSNTGIEFSGIPKAQKLRKNKKNGSYELQFKITNSTESFNVNLVLFPNLTSALNINSSQRFPIRYAGSAKAIPEEEL